MELTAMKKTLEQLGYGVHVFGTAQEASDWLNAEIDGKTVGIGGSMTLYEMGMAESLGRHNEVFCHFVAPEEEKLKLRQQAAETEVYLSSVNGLAETGEIINIDGTGNRVASTIYGHETVYLVIGRNKIAPTYEEALHRARNIAGPKNAQRLGVRTPCAVRGDRCYNCKSPERICRALVVFWEAVKSCRTEIVLVDEDLGY